MNTFLLTRRAADFAVVLGIVLLACALYGALFLSFMDLGWWLGHIFEMRGIVVVGASLVFDLRRGRRSRALVGDLRAAELVAAEEAFLGARVRALMERLGAKDSSTEEHTRRVAMLAVELGEQLGLSPTRLRSLAIGGLLHDIGKLSVPDVDPAEARLARRRRVRRSSSCIPSAAASCSTSSAASTRPSAGSCSTITSGSTAAATRAASTAARSISRRASSRSATSTTRSSRRASTGRRGRRRTRSSLLRDESDIAFDSRCIEALERAVTVERSNLVSTPSRS